MNINPATIHAVAVAEEIGLITGHTTAAAVPNLPPFDEADIVAADTVAVAAAVNTDEDAIAAAIEADIDAVTAAVNTAFVDEGNNAALHVANDQAGLIVKGYVIEGTDDVAPHVSIVDIAIE